MAPPLVFTAMIIFMCLTQVLTSDQKECPSSECKKTAERMKALMNRSVDPCQDFSQFACGQFYTDAVIPPTKIGVGYTFENLREKIYEFYKKMLEEPIARPGMDSYERKMKTYYKACLDTESMEVHGLTDYKDSYRLEWPTLNEEWQASSFTLEKLVANDVKSYTFSLFMIYKDTDFSDPNKPYYIPKMTRTVKDLFRDLDKNSSAMERYYTDVAVALGADPEDAECDAKDVVVFMNDLYKSYSGLSMQRTYTLQEMSTNNNSLNWVKVFQDIYDNLDVQIHLSQNIRTSVVFVKKLGDCLAKTDKRTIQNFLGFKRALKVVGEATKKMRNIKNKFDQRKQQPRDVYCLDKTVYMYNRGLAKLASDVIYPKESQERLQAVATSVKNAFKDSFQDTTLLSPTDRREALLKVQEMGVKIGVQSEHFEDEDLDKVYKFCVVSEDNFNTDNLQNDNTLWAEHLKTSILPYKPYEWKYHLTGERLMIVPERNDIMIQLGVLQPPLFEKNNPSYLNYGTIGANLGYLIHRMIALFRYPFDPKVNRRYSDWSKQTLAKYSERTKCFGRQYSHFTIQSVDEAVKQYESVTHAYRAYKKHPSENDLPLPGLDLTNDQLFFLANAQEQCSKYIPEVAKQRFKYYGVVSPALRLNRRLQNTEGFSTAFNCKAGDPMNPVDKCSMW